jgi:hypothetical protein
MNKEFRKPDVKAPRFRQEAINIIDNEFFDRFKEKFSKYKSLSESDIRKIIKSFNETFWDNVIETRDGVQLPEGLGCIFIGTCETSKSNNIDFAKSKKYGVPVTNKNWETDGKLAKIFYTSYSSKYKFAFRECWSFIACRNFKRGVAKTYPDNWTMYVQVDPHKKLRKMYTAISLNQKRKKELSKQLDNYNEFDL